MDAIVSSTLANVRVRPDQRSELYSQVLLGEGVKIIEERDRWALCRLPDGATGWVHLGSLASGGEALRRYRAGEVHIVVSRLGDCFPRPQRRGHAILLLTCGCRLAITGEEGAWLSAQLPDGRRGWIEEGIARPLSSSPQPAPEAVAATALSFSGIPYHWGGASPLGLDCSGLVQLVYKMFARLLPHRASAQSEMGESIGTTTGWGNLRGGDLLFFAESETIDHVAISLGGSRIIHSSMRNGIVRTESLDEKEETYNARLSQLFKLARRIIAGH